MSKWSEFPMLAYDVETTGISVNADRIITAALVEVRPGSRPTTRHYVTDPGVDISPDATAIHGYDRARLAAEQTHTPEQLLFEVTGLLARWLGQGFPVVVFNGAFDFTMLEVENRRHQVDTLDSRLGRGKVSPILDVYVLDKFADPYRKGGRKLGQVCETYGVRHTGLHEAAGDALAAARLFPKVMARHARKFPGMTLPALHQAQVGWRKTQMDGLRAYFDKQGTVHDGCDGGWPLYFGDLRPAEAGAA